MRTETMGNLFKWLCNFPPSLFSRLLISISVGETLDWQQHHQQQCQQQWWQLLLNYHTWFEIDLQMYLYMECQPFTVCAVNSNACSMWIKYDKLYQYQYIGAPFNFYWQTVIKMFNPIVAAAASPPLFQPPNDFFLPFRCCFCLSFTTTAQTSICTPLNVQCLQDANATRILNHIPFASLCCRLMGMYVILIK